MDLDQVVEYLPLRLWKAVFLGVMTAVGLALAYTHGGGMELVGNGQFETIDGYAFNIALLIGSIIPGMYFVFFRDVSESIAVFLTVVWSLYFGIVDILVYLFLPDTSIPETLPWLNDSFIGLGTQILSADTVTPRVLYIFVAATFLVLLAVIKILYGIEAKFGGVEV